MNIDISKEENDLCWEVFFQGLESPCEKMIQKNNVEPFNNMEDNDYEKD